MTGVYRCIHTRIVVVRVCLQLIAFLCLHVVVLQRHLVRSIVCQFAGRWIVVCITVCLATPSIERHALGERAGDGRVLVHPRYRRVVLLDATPEECMDEDATELLAKGTVQDEVDSAVEIDEEVANVRQDLVAQVVSHMGVVDGVREVVGQCRNLAHDEDHHYRHQHDGDAVLPALTHVHVFTLALRVPHSEDEEEIEDEENKEWYNAHDGHVQPGEVHLQVDGVLTEGSARRHHHRRVGCWVHANRRHVVEPARDVVERRAKRHACDDCLRSRDRAHRGRLEWMTHSDVAFDRERDGQPDGCGLSNQSYRVDVGHYVGEYVSHVDCVVWQRPRDTDQEQCAYEDGAVPYGERRQIVIGRGVHGSL